MKGNKYIGDPEGINVFKNFIFCITIPIKKIPIKNTKAKLKVITAWLVIVKLYKVIPNKLENCKCAKILSANKLSSFPILC